MRLPTVIIGDFHAPFHCRKTLGKALAVIRRLKPKLVIQIGDLYDLYSFSRFPRSLNVLTPAQEIKQGRKACEQLWEEIRAISPKAECFQILGNHDDRLAKQIMGALPEAEGMTARGMWEFDGVTTEHDSRSELILDGVIYMHGYRKFGDHVKYNLQSTVCGHSHTGGVTFLPLKNKTLFELNAGYLANPKSAALSYTQQAKISKWTPGLGVIDQDGPRFIPL